MGAFPERRADVLVLLGFRDDPHLSEVAEIARGRGLRAHVFDAFGETDRLTVTFPDERPRLVAGTEAVDPADVKGVWLRQKPFWSAPGSSPLQEAADRFRQGEWRVALRSLEIALRHAVWVNPPDAQSRIALKPNQLALATRCGLRIPETKVTNDFGEVLEMVERWGELAYKPLTFASFPDQTAVLTNLVDREMVEAARSSIALAPGIFQQFVRKSYELRVTVVGRDVFTARINTPDDGGAAVDWRRAHLDDIFVPDELDDRLRRQLLRFHDTAGLRFGAYDLAASSTGEIYFLECNPAGQYLWLKEKCGLDISPAVASLLASGTRARRAPTP